MGAGFPSRQTRSVCAEIMLKQKRAEVEGFTEPDDSVRAASRAHCRCFSWPVFFLVPSVAQPTRRPPRLLWECNTRQQHSPNWSERLKSQQMLVFFASPAGWRVPNWLQVTEFGCSRLSHASGGAGTGLF